jgi:hypothetical protein
MQAKIIIAVWVSLIYFTIMPFQVHAAKYAAEFLDIGVGARALGMGSAFVALSDDVTAAYWNPAGLARLNRLELGFTHSSNFSDIVRSDYIQLAYPLAHGTWGISWIRVGVDDIPISTRLDEHNRPIIEKRLSDAENAFLASYGHRLSSKFSLGGNIKFLRQSVGEDSSYGFGADVGAMFMPIDKLFLGVQLRDISTTRVVWDTGQTDIRKPALKIGSAYIQEISFLRSHFVVALDADVWFENRSLASQFSSANVSIDLHLGAEYWLFNIIGMRVGLEQKELTAGASIRVKMFQLDYAFIGYELGNTHRVSGSFHF